MGSRGLGQKQSNWTSILVGMDEGPVFLHHDLDLPKFIIILNAASSFLFRNGRVD